MLKRLWKTNAPLTLTALLMLVALAVTSLGLIFDPRMIMGSPAWLKPAKFALSIAVYSFTLAWIFTFIPAFEKTRRIVGWLTAVAMVVELSIISLQAWRGTTSHFNLSTPLNAALFSIMGAVIVLQTVASISVAIALWRQEFADPALGWALRLAIIITIIGAFSGGLMTRPTPDQLAAAHAGHAMTIVGAHTVGAPDGGRGLPGTNWSAAHGDLRVPHFVGLHALQVLPLFALALRRRRLSTGSKLRLTLTAGASYFALFAILLAQALRGQPVLNPDTLTMQALGVWAVVTATCALWSVAHVKTVGAPELA